MFYLGLLLANTSRSSQKLLQGNGMKKVAEFDKSGGKLEIFEDTNKNIFMAQPHGVINPSLLEEDLTHATAFSKRINEPWFYVTNTEDVRLVNPFNLMYLKEVKKLQKLREIVIYAPGFVNRTLIKLAFFIIQPDRIFKKKADFEKFLGVAQGART